LAGFSPYPLTVNWQRTIGDREEQNMMGRFPSGLLRFVSAVAIFNIFLGCNMNQAKVSSDMSELKQLIGIDVPLSSGQWEVFGTPEYTGGPPGPTDFLTLIAELHPSDAQRFEELSVPAGEQFVIPEAGRPWLSAAFRSMLFENRSQSKALHPKFNCKKYETTIKKSGRKVGGFVCNDGKAFLLYLTMANNT
jgi:hypothetical protein